MADIALRVDKLSKRYQLGSSPAQESLREAIMRTMTSWLRVPGVPIGSGQHPAGQFGSQSGRQAGQNEHWALRDVSFQIDHGEVIGIVGRNGAGKSTLLKILSRVTEPTQGRVEGYGRVGSLLEVGTGFHPELTGRENIYLNGVILGMKKREIDRKFTEIVEFAEIGKFLDSPVKHYSSGMYMRLAFAVAAHLEPEILIIDEVLAVGDYAFQKKCLGKMGEVGRTGRTVLFVSHNLTAIENLCQRVLWLHDGRVVEDGPAGAVIGHYMNSAMAPERDSDWPDFAVAPGNDHVRLRRALLRSTDGTPTDHYPLPQGADVEVEYWNLEPSSRLDLSLQLFNEQGILVWDVGRSQHPAGLTEGSAQQLLRDVCRLPGDLLNDGRYYLTLVVSKRQREVYRHERLLSFEVVDTSERRGGWFGRWPGVIRPRLAWRTERVDRSTSDSAKDRRPSGDSR